MSVSVDYLSELFDRLGTMPIHDIMRDDERKAGNEILVPGDVEWLPADDWHETVVVSRRAKEIRLIAILATRPNGGAFRRLIHGILDAGLVPVIIAPSLEMQATMRRWGWHRRVAGSGFQQEDQWRPRKSWRPA